MCLSWLNRLKSEMGIKHFLGKDYIISIFGAVFFLGYAFCGFCDELSMVSVPLGFEISGFDKSKTWVSENGVFALGFLKGTQKIDDVDGFVVGVRYNLGDESVNLPVWSVGGGIRVSMNTTFRLSMDGRLVLIENPSGLILWSSNTFGLSVNKASLLNNGNLVLMTINDNVVWQSFDSPTSTLLPGQSLGFHQTLRAPSVKSTFSYYSLVISRSGQLALMWENNVTYWKSGGGLSSNGFIVKEARFESSGVLSLIDVMNRTAWFVSSKDYPSPVLRHLRIDVDGNLRIYSWDGFVWRIGWQAVGNQCNVFGYCGLYSLCGFNSTGPVCHCLYDDSIQDTDFLDYGNFRCRKMVDLGNCKINTSMTEFKKTSLYSLYPPQDIDMMLNEDACKEYCSTDPTCIASTARNDGSGICTIKRTVFISGYSNPSVQANSFLKVCRVPQAVSAIVAHSPNINANTISGGYANLERDNKKSLGVILLIILVTILGFFSVQMFMFFLVYRKHKIIKTRLPFGKNERMNLNYSHLVRFSFEEITDITANFAYQLSPLLYKGVLPNKIPVTAKKLEDIDIGIDIDIDMSEKDFRLAVSRLGGMHHRNLVLLKGYCFEGKHKYLVYEYVVNGPLDVWLFDTKLDRKWDQRFDIALGVARAVCYLHTECETCVAHGNLKLQNVLLDENLVPKVTEFRLQTLLVRKKSSGSGSLSETLSERDVYMFGEMLLQMVTCRSDVLSSCCVNGLFESETITREEVKSEEGEGMERAVRIACWCLQSQPFLRPSIGEVVKVLEGTLSVDRPPPLDFAFRDTIE